MALASNAIVTVHLLVQKRLCSDNKKSPPFVFSQLSLCEGSLYDYHHHHPWLDSPMWALAFLRNFCQLKYPAIASSDFVTRVFSRVGLLARRPTPGYPRGPMFSVRVVSLSRLVPILKRQNLDFCPCMT
jgi:hypothetical protein